MTSSRFQSGSDVGHLIFSPMLECWCSGLEKTSQYCHMEKIVNLSRTQVFNPPRDKSMMTRHTRQYNRECSCSHWKEWKLLICVHLWLKSSICKFILKRKAHVHEFHELVRIKITFLIFHEWRIKITFLIFNKYSLKFICCFFLWPGRSLPPPWTTQK